MGQGSDKELRVSLGIDTASFDKGIGKVRQLISEVNKLTEATNRMGTGSKISTQSLKAGVGSGAIFGGHQTRVNTGSAGTDQLTKVVTNTATAMSGAAKAGTTALRDLDKVFNDVIFSADGRIRRLMNLVGSFGSAMQKVKSSTGGGVAGGGNYGISGMMSAAGIAGPPQIGGNDTLSPFWPTQQKSGVPSWMTNRIPGTPNLPTSGMGLGGQMLGGIGAGLGVAAGVAVLGSKLMEMRSGNQIANLGYGLQSATYGLERKGELGQTYGGMALRIKGGDLALSAAMARVTQNEGYKKVLGNQAEMDRISLMKLNTPVSFMDRPSLGRAFTMGKEGVGAALNGGPGLGGGGGSSNPRAGYFRSQIGGAVSGGDPGVLTQSVIERKKAENDNIMAQTRAHQAAVEAEYASNPVYNEYINRKASGAMGSIALARSARLSGGTQMIRDPKTGKMTKPMDSVDLFRSRGLLGGGWSEGEMAGMIGQIGGVGRGLGGGAAESLLSATSGGLGNAVALYGLGAQFGRGGGNRAGRSFLGGLQGAIGRGGLDITAGQNIFTTGAGLMQGGNFSGASGAGLMSALAGAAFEGTPGGDMMGARIAASGMNAMSSQFSGGIDNFQMGSNASAALQVAGDLPYQSQKALMSIDPAMLMETLKSGHVPSQIKQQFPKGMSDKEVFGIVSKYAERVDTTSLATYADQQGAGTAVGDAVTKYRESGMKGYLSGFKGRGAKLEALKTIAVARTSVRGGTFEENLGLERNLASSMGLLGPGPRGAGAHQSVGKNNFYMGRARAEGKKAYIEAERGGENAKTETNLAETSNEAVEAAEKLRTRTQSAGGDAYEAAGNIKNALDEFVNAIMRMSNAPVAGQGKGKSSAPRGGKS